MTGCTEILDKFCGWRDFYYLVNKRNLTNYKNSFYWSFSLFILPSSLILLVLVQKQRYQKLPLLSKKESTVEPKVQSLQYSADPLCKKVMFKLHYTKLYYNVNTFKFSREFSSFCFYLIEVFQYCLSLTNINNKLLWWVDGGL